MSIFFSLRRFQPSKVENNSQIKSFERRHRLNRQRLQRRLLTESLEPRQMLDAEDLVRFVLTARDIETDELINNAEGVVEMAASSEQTLNYEVPINEVFKLEVAVQDLRDRGSDFGIFRAVTDIVVESKGVLEPAIGEVQEIILPGTITNSGLPAGQVELFLEDAPNTKVTLSLSAFLGANDQAVEQNIANAIVALNSQVTSVSQIDVDVFHKPKAGPGGEDGYVIEIVYTDPNFINADMPMLSANVRVGTVTQPDIENEFDVYVDGAINGERMYHFFETLSRNVGNTPVYGQNRVIGDFDSTDAATDIFDEVGGLGPVSSGGVRDGIPDFDRLVAYDAFAIPVIARSLASDIVVRLDAPDVGDKVLLYGTEANKEVVPDDQLQFGGNSRFFLNVTPPKPKLDASATSRTLIEDQDAITIDLSTLVDADPGALTYSLTSSTALGTSSLSGTTLTYTPVSDAFGTEPLTYRVTRDGTSDFDQAVITFDITGVNDAPIANDDDRSTNEDTPLAISIASLLANDTDVDPDDTPSFVSIGDASHGTAVRDGDTIYYTSSANYFGPDSFTYTMQDSAGIQRSATVRIDVLAVNDPPTATGEIEQTEPDTPIVFAIADLLANDSAGPLESDQSLSITAVGGLLNPSSSVVIDGDFIRYTPAAEFTGSDGFTYTVSDGFASVTADVLIDVNYVIEPVNFVLPDATSNDITVRRNDETFLEIVDNSTSPPSRLMRRPLDTITALTITGSDIATDRVHIDHASGGLLTFIGSSTSIQVLGGSSAGDELSLTGVPNANVLLAESDSQATSMLVGLITNLQVGALASNHTLRGFETVSIEDVRQISVPSSSVLDVDAHELKLDSEFPVNLSRNTRIDGGTLTSTAQLILGSGDVLAGNGHIVAPTVAPIGSTISADGGDLTIGIASSTNSIDIAGQLNTFENQITLIDGDAASLRGNVTIGGAGNAAGSIASATGIEIQVGAQVTGHGSITTGDDPINGLTNNGTLLGSTSASPITVDGRLTGTGTINNVRLARQWAPTGEINNRLDGNVALTSTASLAVDIGGTSAGITHERFRFNPSASLDGTLGVNLTGGFSPSAGHEFSIISAMNSLSGAFDTVNLPDLVDGLKWNINQSATTLTLQVALDGSALSENVNVEITPGGQIIIRGQNDQPIPIAGNQLTLDVVPTQKFASPQIWTVQPTQTIDGIVYQIATNGTATLRIAGAKWTNFIQRFDINASGSVTATDALVIINELNGPQFSSSDSLLEGIETLPSFPNLYFDTNGDGRVSAVDALQVINRLIEQDAAGESVDVSATALVTAPALPTATVRTPHDVAVQTPEILSPLSPRATDVVLVDWSAEDQASSQIETLIDQASDDEDEAASATELEASLDLLFR